MNTRMKKIFVVDDDPAILLFMEALLEDAGHRVAVSEKGDALEKLVPDDLPHLIILDMLLSGKDGREIARKLKASELTRHIPIIMISAHPGAESAARAAGADAFLAKPFEMDDLLALVEGYLDRS